MNHRLVDYFVVVELQPVPDPEGADPRSGRRARGASDASLLSDASTAVTTAASEEDGSSEAAFSDACSDGTAASLRNAAGYADSPPSLQYAPAVVDRYPPRDYENKPLEPFTANFALPVDDAPLAFSDDRRRSIYTFVLTNSARELTFGTTLRFCEATPDPNVFMPKALCVLSAHAWLAPLFEGFLLNLHDLTMFRVLTLPLEVYVQHFVEHASLPRPGSTLRFKSDATFVIEDEDGNVVSRKVSPARSRASSRSNTIAASDKKRSSPSAYSPSGVSPASSLIPSTSNPSAGPSTAAANHTSDDAAGSTGFLGLDALSYHRAPSNTLDAVRGCVGAHFETLMSCLDASNVLLVLNAMVLDSKLMFHSRHVERLTASLEALCALLFPFDWHHVYVPITPDHPDFLQMLDEEIIMPFIFGLHSDTFERVLKTSSGLSEVFIIDLDKNQVYVPPSAVEEGGGMTGMSERFVPLPRHLVLRALEGIRRIVPPRLAARAAPAAWGGDRSDAAFTHPGKAAAEGPPSSSDRHDVHWHFRPADEGERILDPWSVKQAAAMAVAAQEKRERAAAEKKAADAAEKSIHDHHNKGHNPLIWLFNKRSRKNVASHAERNDGGGGGGGGGSSGSGGSTSDRTRLGRFSSGTRPDDIIDEAGACSGASSGASSINGDYASFDAATLAATRKPLVDVDLEDSLLDLFSLWFTGRHAGALGIHDAQQVGQKKAVHVHGEIADGEGSRSAEKSLSSAQSARLSSSWVDVLRCAILEIFMSLLKDLPRYTYSLQKKKKKLRKKSQQDQKRKSSKELHKDADEIDLKEAYVFPENVSTSADGHSRPGRLDMDDFLDSIDVSASQAFVQSLRSTQLWQQFQGTWESGIVNPDMKLFRGCIKRYVSGNESRTRAGEMEDPNHDPRALVTRNYQACWEELETTWWRQLCYERKSDDAKMQKRNEGISSSIKPQLTLSVLGRSSMQPTPEFHVYAESVFPRFEQNMFEPTPISGRRTTSKQSMKARRGSAKAAVVKISLDDVRSNGAAGSKGDADEDVTAHTPLRKRRVSISAMTALRFSMQEEQQQQQQRRRRQSNREHQPAGGNSGQGVIGKVVGDPDLPRGRQLGSRASQRSLFHLGDIGAQDEGVMGAGLFVPAGARTDIRLLRQPSRRRADSINILDDVRRLIAQTPRGGDAKEKERIRRRLVDELFAMRVGGDGGGSGEDPMYASPSSRIEF